MLTLGQDRVQGQPGQDLTQSTVFGGEGLGGVCRAERLMGCHPRGTDIRGGTQAVGSSALPP